MDTLTISDFKRNMSSSLNRIDAGEQVYFRRGHQIYTIIPVQQDNVITPALSAIIEHGRRDSLEGQCVACNTHEELSSFLDSL